MKILFYATYPTIGTGYSRIGNILSNYLAEQNHDVYYFGISNFKNSSVVERYIHPSIKLIDALFEEQKRDSSELYGVNVIIDAIKQIQPDIVFLYNDIIVISRIFNNFIDSKLNINFKTIVYLDLVYEFEKIKLIRHIDKNADQILVFSDCWKKNLIECGIDTNKINVLPHGFDDNKFYTIDKQYCRKKFNFAKDDFIILNTNRNSYRKSIDKTIDAFLQFLKIKGVDRRIKLFLNMLCTDHHKDEGYDIINLIKIGCIKYDLNYEYVITNHIYKNPTNHNSYSDEMLNYLYNATDIGINTCVGEGFGLCNLEHAGVGKPQIISNVGALGDIFNNEYSTLIEPVTEMYITNNIDFHGGFLKICRSLDFMQAMVKYFDDRELIEKHGGLAKEKIVEKYDWKKILESLNNIILNVFEKLEITRNKIKRKLDFLTVYNYDRKIRLGNNEDGGYVIGEIDDLYDCYISCGIANEESFSRDFIKKYYLDRTNSFGFDGTIENYPTNYTNDITFINKNINCFNDDKNDNLDRLIQGNKLIFLKMDIEGGEYNWILGLDDKQLDNFKQIVIEFHGLGDNSYNCSFEKKIECLEKLSRVFYLIHAHANNYDRIFNNLPRVLELTYINKKYFNGIPSLNKTALPIKNLDFPNCESKKEIILDFPPFTNN